jgi:hypothetical protein
MIMLWPSGNQPGATIFAEPMVQLAEFTADKQSGEMQYEWHTYETLPLQLWQSDQWSSDLRDFASRHFLHVQSNEATDNKSFLLFSQNKRFTQTFEVQAQRVDKAVKLTISLRTNDQLHIAPTVKLFDQLQDLLQRHQLELDWQRMVHGTFINERNFDQFQKSLLSHFGARAVDTYQADRDLDRTYQTAQFRDAAMSGENAIQLQLNAHRHSVSNDWHFSMGAPLVTIIR